MGMSYDSLDALTLAPYPQVTCAGAQANARASKLVRARPIAVVCIVTSALVAVLTALCLTGIIAARPALACLGIGAFLASALIFYFQYNQSKRDQAALAQRDQLVAAFGNYARCAVIAVDAATKQPVYVSPNMGPFLDADIAGGQAWLVDYFDLFGHKTPWTPDPTSAIKMRTCTRRHPVTHEELTLTERCEQAVFDGRLVDLYVFCDQTAKQNMRRSIALAFDMAHGAQRQTHDFLMRASHDLRTPASAVAGITQLMERDTQNPGNLMEHAKHLSEATGSLCDALTQVLAASDEQTPLAGAPDAPFLLSDLMAAAESRASQAIGARDMHLCSSLKGVGDVALAGNRDHLTVLLSILLDNAVKYGKPGGHIALACETAPLAGGHVHLRIELADDGIGMSELLEDEGAQTTAVPDGQEALETFLSAPANTYDLVLMDLQMPKMDGFEATRQIRSSTKLDAQRVPIVAISANGQASDRNASVAAGMSSHLVKPLRMDELATTLEALNVRAKNVA